MQYPQIADVDQASLGQLASWIKGLPPAKGNVQVRVICRIVDRYVTIRGFGVVAGPEEWTRALRPVNGTPEGTV